jgi:ABC-type Fe3+-hydroxamate transport system substrate-binding protein
MNTFAMFNQLYKDKLKNVSAIQKNHVYQMDSDIAVRSGPRIGQGLKTLAELIHRK